MAGRERGIPRAGLGRWGGLPPAVESGHGRDSELQEETNGWGSSPKSWQILG